MLVSVGAGMSVRGVATAGTTTGTTGWTTSAGGVICGAPMPEGASITPDETVVGGSVEDAPSVAVSLEQLAGSAPSAVVAGDVVAGDVVAGRVTSPSGVH
jgi:hypothetical protein